MVSFLILKLILLFNEIIDMLELYQYLCMFGRSLFCNIHSLWYSRSLFHFRRWFVIVLFPGVLLSKVSAVSYLENSMELPASAVLCGLHVAALLVLVLPLPPPLGSCQLFWSLVVSMACLLDVPR